MTLSYAYPCLALHKQPAALLKLVLGGPSAPAWSGHAGGAPPGLRRGAGSRRRNVGRT